MSFARFLSAFAFAATAFGLSPSAVGPLPIAEAEAAVSIAYTLDELVGDSAQAAIVKAVKRSSKWEVVGGSKRIVTYTLVEIEEQVFGQTKTKTVWVRTLGGAVDKIGQQVAGEAQLHIGKRSLVFLARAQDDAWVVTGMSQGHYPIVAGLKDEPTRLQSSHSLGTILPRRGPSVSAHEELVGVRMSEALVRVREAKARVDAARKR